MFKAIISESSGARFNLLTNADKKQWLIPHRNMRTALQLYQPSAWKGRMVKAFLPLLKAFPGLLARVHIVTECYALNPRLEEILCTYFNTPEIEFSVFLGTPSVHQKPTLQISSGNRILGYCKASDQPCVKKLFLHEQKLLDEFKKKQIERLPECLYCGPFRDDIWLFVQTTTKTPTSKIVHKWTEQHWKFLTQLHDKTKIKCSFDESDLAGSLRILESYLDRVSREEVEILEKAISLVRAYYSIGTFEFSAYLADFTPWNTYCENGDLYAFDLEYAGMIFPPYMDFFHFNTQIAIYEKQYTVKQNYKFCQKMARDTVVIPNFSTLYLSYLLSVISLYFDRDRKPMDRNDRIYSYWLSLIALIVKQ